MKDIEDEIRELLDDIEPYVRHKLNCSRPLWPDCNCGLERMRSRIAELKKKMAIQDN